MQATSQLMKSFELFQGLNEPELQTLAQSAQVQRFARRAIILTARKKENRVCFLFEGRLQGVDFTIDGREVGIYFVNQGDFCGELCVFDDGAQPEHVIALNSSVVVFVPTIHLKDIANRNPKIMSRLGSKLASRVRQMTVQRSLLGLPNIPQRVCSQLWMLIKVPNSNQRANIEIKNAPTHMEIAIMLNVSRETVTRVFQQLQKQKIVARDGPNKLIIKAPDEFEKIAEGKIDITGKTS